MALDFKEKIQCLLNLLPFSCVLKYLVFLKKKKLSIKEHEVNTMLELFNL